MRFASIFNRKKKLTSPSSSTMSPNGSQHSHGISSGKNTLIPEKELEQVFRRFDINRDGKISASELGSVMSSLGHNATGEELDKMMREIDSDGDGFIDFNEFVVLNTKGIDYEEIIENLKDAFSVYDIDGNGSITAEELFEVLRSLGDDCTIAECKKMISCVDCDGDGTIDFEEFKVMMMMGSRYEFDSVERQVAI